MCFGLRVSGIPLRVSGISLRVSGILFRVSGISLRVSGISLKVSGISLTRIHMINAPALLFIRWKWLSLEAVLFYYEVSRVLGFSTIPTVRPDLPGGLRAGTMRISETIPTYTSIPSTRNTALIMLRIPTESFTTRLRTSAISVCIDINCSFFIAITFSSEATTDRPWVQPWNALFRLEYCY